MRHLYQQSKFFALACAFTTACGGAAKTDEADAPVADTQSTEETAAADAADSAADSAAAGDPAAQKAILAVKAGDSWTLNGLAAAVQVLRTEGNIPHIYAQNRKDLAHAMGFIMARDRYFQMELTRRVGLGTISNLLGDAALAKDIEARASGSAFVADNILSRLTQEQKDVFDGFAAGINDYIAMVAAKKLPEPSEIGFAGPLLGGTAATLLKPWDRRSVAGASAAIIYNLGYETDDPGRTQTLAGLAEHYKGKALADLRTDGALVDIEYHVAPIKPISSAAGLGLDMDGVNVPKTTPGVVPGGKREGKAKKRKSHVAAALPADMFDRMQARFAERERRNGHDRVNGFGSNSWAVMGTAAKDGRALVAGDGHLPLSVPSLFYAMGLDDSVFGGGNEHTVGLSIPGLPLMAVGTNGYVGWSQTQLVGDITDWYREELKLDANGAPKATIFQGKEVAVAKVDEKFEIANVPVLGSVGRVETWARYTTADGRWIYDIEGPAVDGKTYKAKPGETVIALAGRFVVPTDSNADGKITAVSFDFTGLDNPDIIGGVDGFGHAKNVFEFRDATRHLVAYSQNMVAADADGHVFYSGYQAVPCRSYLPRQADGKWKVGANPKQLIDATLYPSFTIPLKPDGTVDEEPGKTDPTKCVVPFDEYPNSIDPKQGYVVTANNDPGNLSTDNSLSNDKWYIGGPWANGYRADTIAQGCAANVKDKSASMESMAKIQANNQSRLGDEWVPFFLAQVASVKQLAASGKPPSADELRLVDLYKSITPADLDDAIARLQKWHDGGSPALSGVVTFYHPDLGVGEVEYAIATTIFNAWFDKFVNYALDDEGINVWEPWGGDARTRALSYFRDGMGPDNKLKQVSWNKDTGESAFFDKFDTPQIETAREIVILALKAGLDASAKTFSTGDHSKWIWGLRHGVHFNSLLADFLGSKPEYATLTEAFSISPSLLPLAPKYDKGDPRADLKQFPRGGDGFAVDAAGGVNSDGYGSGPVFRLVIALGKDAAGKPTTTAQNILPGGQSGLTDDPLSPKDVVPNPLFSDQVKLWLANKTMPMQWSVADVVAAASVRETFVPAK